MQREGRAGRLGVVVCASLLVAAWAGSRCWGGDGPTDVMQTDIDLSKGVGHGISDMSEPLTIWAAATMASLREDGPREVGQRCLDAMIVNSAATHLLKALTHAPRPGSATARQAELGLAPGPAYGSFPSGHTSSAFAFATVIAENDPDRRWLWYGLAGAVGWARVEVNAHHVRDVIAGAALGTYVAQCSLRSDEGLLNLVRAEPGHVYWGDATLTFVPALGPEGVNIITAEF